MADERRPWDQLPDEPSAAYARFLVYRNLGAARSVDAAYHTGPSEAKRGKARRASSQWFEDSVHYQWPERAAAWDIENLTTLGHTVVVKFINILEGIAARALESIHAGKVKPKDWHGVMEAVSILGSFIPPETVAAVQSDARERRISAIGGGSKSDARAGGGDPSAGGPG